MIAIHELDLMGKRQIKYTRPLVYTYDMRSLHTPLRYCDNSTSPPDPPSLQVRAARPPQGLGMLGGGIGFLSIFSAFDSTVRIDSPDSQLRSDSYQIETTVCEPRPTL